MSRRYTQLQLRAFEAFEADESEGRHRSDREISRAIGCSNDTISSARHLWHDLRLEREQQRLERDAFSVTRFVTNNLWRWREGGDRWLAAELARAMDGIVHECRPDAKPPEGYDGLADLIDSGYAKLTEPVGFDPSEDRLSSNERARVLEDAGE